MSTTLEPTPAPTTPKPMHIVSLTVNNILKLKAVEIVPNGNVVTLSGDNESGKSSCLNAICMALGGSAFIPERPIRNGSSKGDITLDLGDIIITRKFSASGSSLDVKAKDGAGIKSPQGVLDSLWSRMCDPVQFIRLSETTEGQRKQGEVLRKLVGLDFTKLDADRAKAYAARTTVNAEVDKLEANLKNFPLNPDAPETEVLAADLLTQLQTISDEWQKKLDDAAAHNEKNKTKRSDLQTSKDDFSDASDDFNNAASEIIRVEKELAKLKQEQTARQQNLEQQKKDLEIKIKEVAALEEQDLGTLRYQATEAKKPIEEKIRQADDLNLKVRGNRRHMEIFTELGVKVRAAAQLTAQIEQFDKDKQDQLSAAKYPLPGLGFTDDGVLINGIPFAQGSQAQQLKAAIAIGLALNPRVRVILVRDASLFDKKSLALVEQMAKDLDAQIWFEIVDSDNPAAIEIADGEVVE